MSSGGYSGITNGTSGAQGSLEQMNAEFQAKENENSVSAKATAPIQKAGDLRYNRKKTEGYLLNKEHPQGGPKAKFMEDVLGYSKSDSILFHKSIVESIIGKNPNKTQQTKFGLKHTYNTIVKGKNGKNTSANVVVVIQKDNNRTTYKIITVYPDRKE
ncbi:MAG: hypothetical protein IKT01_06095 [Eubacteriaceae bacterium]|nr:hypothetical protein [Eubacteriaceae bacterium]